MISQYEMGGSSDSSLYAGGNQGRLSTAQETGAAIEPKFSLAMLGLLFYLFVEYARLSALFPILEPLNIGKLAVAVAALGYLMSEEKAVKAPSMLKFVDTSFVALLIVVGIGMLLSNHVSAAMKEWINAIRWWGVYFVLSRVLSSSWRLRLFIVVWILLNLKLAQFVVRNYAYYHGTTNEMTLVTAGIGAGTSGFFSNSADLGVAMCVVWPVSIALLFSKPRLLLKIVLSATAILSLVAILQCGSRGAVVGAAAVAVFTWLKTPKRLAPLLMVAMLVVGIYFVLPNASKKRFERAENPDKDFTAHHRLLLWHAGVQMFLNNPVFGVGINNFPLVRYESYPLPRPFQHFKSVPHSSYIECIAELGVTGTLCLLCLVGACFRMTFLTRRALVQRDPGARRSFEFCLATGIDLGMIGYLASGAFVAVLWYPHIFVLLGTAAGLYSTVVGNSRPSFQTSFSSAALLESHSLNPEMTNMKALQAGIHPYFGDSLR